VRPGPTLFGAGGCLDAQQSGERREPSMAAAPIVMNILA
jgi:hypothetical protein